jgi:hypothetical protein
MAMQTGTFLKFSGQVEVDETFIGGKARFMLSRAGQMQPGLAGSNAATLRG